MALSSSCRLCLNMCSKSKKLYDKNDCANELYRITEKLLHPEIVNMDMAKHLTTICLQCWQHLNDFESFQKVVLEAQMKLVAIANDYTVKFETEDTITVPKIKAMPVDKQAVLNEAVLDDDKDLDDDEALDDNEVQVLDNNEHKLSDSLSDETSSLQMSDSEITDKDSDYEISRNRDENLTDTSDTEGDTDKPQVKTNADKPNAEENSNAVSKFRQKYCALKIDMLVAKYIPQVNCSKCKKSFKTFSQMKYHFKASHSNDEFRFKCPCSRSEFKYNITVKDHFLIHYNPNFFNCNICGHNKCKTKIALIHHLSRHHVLQKLQPAKVSKKSIVRRQKKKLEAGSSKQQETKKTKIEIIDIDSSDEISVKSEISNSFQMQAPNNIALDIYRRYTEQHLGDLIDKWLPDLKCDHCSDKVSNFLELQQHFRQKHRNEIMYISCFCEYKTNSLVSIKDHLLIHNNSKFFNCEICGNNLCKTKHALHQHITEKHSEYLKNPCRICGQCFNSEPSLNEHVEHAHKRNESENV